MLRHSMLFLALFILLSISAQNQAQETPQACSQACIIHYANVELNKFSPTAGMIAILNESGYVTNFSWGPSEFRISYDLPDRTLAYNGVWFYWGEQTMDGNLCFIRFAGDSEIGYSFTQGCNSGLEDAFASMNARIDNK